MCVGVTVWFGWGGVVSGCRLKHCFSLQTLRHEENTPNINTITKSHSRFVTNLVPRQTAATSNPQFARQH
jgi:hypothetical protein